MKKNFQNNCCSSKIVEPLKKRYSVVVDFFIADFSDLKQVEKVVKTLKKGRIQ